MELWSSRGAWQANLSAILPAIAVPRLLLLFPLDLCLEVWRRFIGGRFIGGRFIGGRFIGVRFIGGRFIGGRFIGGR